MTKQKTSHRRTAEPTIIALHSPDVARQVQALRLILDVQARKRQHPGDTTPASQAVTDAERGADRTD